MLSKHHRIQRKDFDTYFRRGKVFRSPSVSLRIGKLGTHEKTQVAVVVSKKTAKKAVERHRIKRRLYSIIQKHLPSLPPASIIIIANKGGQWSHEALATEVGQVLGQAFGANHT